MAGQLYRDVSGKTIIVDGVLASLFYAFDRYPDKAVINATLARTFGFEALKSSRALLYQAFSLQDDNRKITEKRTEQTLLKDLWEKVTKIDLMRLGDVIITMPYNFSIPQFVSDADYQSEIARNTGNVMMLERMSALEKKMEDKNSELMKMLQFINTRVSEYPPVPSSGTPYPSFTQSYASAAAPGSPLPRFQGQQQNSTQRGTLFRERTASFKRPRPDNDVPIPSKRKNIEKKIVIGSRTQENSRKMKSPPVDIFVYGIPKDTIKEDIIADLADSDIQISESDIVLMSKGTPVVVSYKISVKAEDLEKALNPTVWPLRVKVREFIHYRSRDKGQNLRNVLHQPTSTQRNNTRAESRNNGNPGLIDGNIYNVLDNDVQAN